MMTRRLAPLAPLILVLGCGDDDGSAGDTTGAPSSASATTSASDPTAGESSSSTGAPATTTGTPSTESGDPPATGTAADTTSGSETGSTDTIGPVGGVPTSEAELLEWLEAGMYTAWAAEAESHPSAGPHFTSVRTFVNEDLLGSLEGGGEDHPVGSATVKELFGAGPDVAGWAVLVKVAPGSSVDNWYWYEWFEGETFADGTGIDGCGNCHGLGVDYIRTELPL